MLCGLFFVVLTLLYADIKRLKKENELLRQLAALQRTTVSPYARLISSEEASQFAADWFAAWNNHDLDGIVRHYADSIEFTSPFIVTLFNEPSGTIRGKDALRTYFQKGLEMFPDLHFDIIEVLAGVSEIVIFYKGVNGRLASEAMTFNSDGFVTRASVCYYQPI